MAGSNLVPWVPTPETDFSNIKVKHPIDVYQTFSMSCVTQPPIQYTLKNDYKDSLSTFQQESVARIVTCLLKNRSFLLGDGTGIGKGRILAAVASELEEKTIWISSSLKLRNSAIDEMDMVCPKKSYGLEFFSYSSIKKKLSSILEKMEKEDYLVIVDECHQLRNCNITMKNVNKLLLKAKYICYSSATAASCIKHLSYLIKMNIWGSRNSPFDSWKKLESVTKNDGPALLELISLYLCQNGQYLCRQLDTRNINFEIKTIDLDFNTRQIYKKCAKAFWDFDGKRRQSLFLKLIVLFKVKYTIKLIKEYLKQGKSIIVSLSNTGEATLKRLKNNNEKIISSVQEACDECGLDLELGLEPIDQILKEFGKNKVSEITGRKIRPCGPNKFESVPPDEIASFQSNKKKIAILSKSGGMGLSLHDSTGNAQRVHIILEIPWSVEDFLQQLGRVYRANAKSTPKYVVVSSDIPSEKRILFSITKKLKSIGAIVKADRSAYEIPGIDESSSWNGKVKSKVGMQLAISRRYHHFQEDIVNNDYENHTRSLPGLMHYITNGLTRYDLDSQFDFNINTWSICASFSKKYFNTIWFPLFNTWSPDSHRNFSDAFKLRAKTFLLCTAKNKYLNTLPDTIIQLIIEKMNFSVETVKTISEWTHISDKDLSKATTESIFNDILCMPIDVQEEYYNLLQTNIIQQKQCNRMKSILDYSKDMSGSPHILTSIKNIEKIINKTVSHVVSIEYKIIENNFVPESALFWKNINTSKIVWTNSIPNGECTNIDGNTTIFDKKNYVESTRIKWNKHVTKQKDRLQILCNQLPSKFHISTDKALYCWEESLKRIVQFECDGKTRVGLILMISP